MNNNFYKKKVLVSGSSFGIGFDIARNFANHGCQIGLNGKRKLKLKKAQKKIKNSEIFQFDLSKKNTFKLLRSQIKKRFGNLDILICNLGNSDFSKNHLDITYSFEKNFFPTVNLISSLSDLINKNGRIICISSICGLEYVEGSPFGYSIAKSAINSYVKCYSRFYAKKKITINAIAPGNILFKNSVWEKKLLKNKAKVINYVKKNVPLNRFGSASDISSLCLYLCSDEAQFINGSIITIDGGQTKFF